MHQIYELLPQPNPRDHLCICSLIGSSVTCSEKIDLHLIMYNKQCHGQMLSFVRAEKP